MTVPTISTLSSGTESSSKLLKSDSNTDNTGTGLSFSATMNETASNYKFDDQHYMLSDGQVLTAEELLEMLENGNLLPGMNLPSLQELQQYKLQAGLNQTTVRETCLINPSQQTLSSPKFGEPGFVLEPTNNVVNDKFKLTQQQFLTQQLNQNQILKVGTAVPEQFRVSMDAVAKATPDTVVNGFTAAYGYQSVSGPEGTTGLMSNSFSISTPVQHPQWNQSLGQNVQWMVNQNIQQAEIKLNPPDLGMLDIRITVNNDQASVHFTAPNSAVRDAIESAMPRLREMLEQSGISLADANVSEHSPGQGEHDSNADDATRHVTIDENTNTGSADKIGNSPKQMQIGLLDTYA